MIKALRSFKKSLLRRINYAVRRPRPPVHPEPFTGPVLVVGSAPVSHLPEGFNDSFCVMTVNGAQVTTKKWGIPVPHVTFLQQNQIGGANTNAVSVRSVLTGERTGRLHVLLWPGQRQQLEKALAALDYRYDNLAMINRYERMALHDSVIGGVNAESQIDMQFSNGITAVLYAIHNGARTVIISGINPDSQGHSYNNANLVRKHVQKDRDILLTIRDRGFPLYTADPEVAQSLGLPLWTGGQIHDHGEAGRRADG